MLNTRYKILVWLPSPMGDAVLCTPALRAIRQHFRASQIAFFANPVVREVLSPGSFNDIWLEQQSTNFCTIARMLRKYGFTHVFLFKNSLGSALAACLAGIPTRIGYGREARSLLLTAKLYPPKLSRTSFRPYSMVDYYLVLVMLWIAMHSRGSDKIPGLKADRTLVLDVAEPDKHSLQTKLPEVTNCTRPVVILVPGGGFGPSKCWPAKRFAQTADWLIKNYSATVVLSVAANPLETQIAGHIADSSSHKLINLADRSLSLGELKALFADADLVISNDTGPRHIAVALGRSVITLFGPNDPAWTDTACEHEVRLIGNVPCAPCQKPTCSKGVHLCMEAITVEMVCQAAKKLLQPQQKKTDRVAGHELPDTSRSFFVDRRYETALGSLGLTSIEAVFAFNAGKNMTKRGLARYRSRLRVRTDDPPAVFFVKRYDKPPIIRQLRNWLAARSRLSCAYSECEAASILSAMGIAAPRTVSFGEQWGTLFEKRSFIITEQIPDAEALERKLPGCFSGPATARNLKLRRAFIKKLAGFVRRFHGTGYRHRDLYLSHIFYSDARAFCLIDLARTFKPLLLAERFRTKDITQLYYSAPAEAFSRTDRLRFYLAYAGRDQMTPKDKAFVRKILKKAGRMAKHDQKHARPVPFTA